MLAEPVHATEPAPLASGVSVPAVGLAAPANGAQTHTTAAMTATASAIVRILPRTLTRRDSDRTASTAWAARAARSRRYGQPHLERPDSPMSARRAQR